MMSSSPAPSSAASQEASAHSSGVGPSARPPPPEPPPQGPLEVALRRLPLWSQGLSHLTQFAVLVAITCVIDFAPRMWRDEPLPLEMSGSLALPMLCVGALAVALVRRLLARLQPLVPISFHADHVRLPRSPESRRMVSLPYAEVVGVLEGGIGPRRLLVIESKRQIFTLPDTLFAEADGGERIARELRRRILALPQGTELVESTARRRREAQGRMAAPALCSQALAGVMAVMFAASFFKGSLQGAFDLIRWGAMVPVLTAGGELFRPIAASFLHTGVWQALVCIGTFYALASLVERLIGWPRLAMLVATGSALVMGAQALQGRVVTVGASGAIFTLLGSFAWLSRRLRLVLPLGVLQPARWWVFVVGLHLVFTLLWPLTDLTVLAVGFTWGLLATQTMLGRGGPQLPELAPRGWQVAGGVGVAAIALSLAGAVNHARQNTGDEDLAVARALLSATDLSAQAARTAMARGWVDAPLTGPARLRCARDLAARNRQIEPQKALHADTLARAMARLRDTDAALAEARSAVDMSGGQLLFLMNLGRILSRRYQEKGALAPAGVDAREARLHIEPSSGDIVLDALPPGGPWQVYALLRHHDRPLALIMASAAADDGLPLHLEPVPRWQRQQLSRFELVAAWVAPLGASSSSKRPQLGMVPIFGGSRPD